MIEALLEKGNILEALIQAQLWQEDLRDRGVPAEDPRMARIPEVIAALQQRLAPPVNALPEVVQQFRKGVDRLADHLRAGRLAEAERQLT